MGTRGRVRAALPRRTLRLAIVVALFSAALATVLLGQTHASGAEGKVASEVMVATADGGQTDFIIYMKDQADLSAAYSMTDQDARGRYVYETLKRQAAETQGPVKDVLDARGVSYESFWVANVIMAQGDRADVEALADRSDVQAIESDMTSDWVKGDDAPETIDEGNAVEAIESGLNKVNAPTLWALGDTGQGIVVANQDTGMRWTHNSLKNEYRGWNGSTADHNYNWFDAVHARITNADGGTPSPATNSCGYNLQAPCDDQGHGTHTTGTIVGFDGGTNQIGMAPGAKWIGCRNMDAGNGRAFTYAGCFQFFLAPTDLAGNNPDPTKRPHVMNNSWGCPQAGELCAPNTLKAIVEASEASGIFVVASAGNDGPQCSTVQDPPGIYSSAFSIAAVDGRVAGATTPLASFSSRGPVNVDGSGRMKPDIAAPGVSVRSSLRNNDTAYGNMSGTSMASPHVVGAVALLWSGRPALSRDIARTKWLLTHTTNPAVSVANNAAGCGGIGSAPNNHFGWGRLDVLAAYNGEPAMHQTIDLTAPASKTYGDPDFAIAATASSGLPVTLGVSGTCTLNGTTVHITGAGSCVITASQAGDTAHFAAPDVVKTVAIAKADQTITFAAIDDKTLGDADFDVAPTASSGLPVSLAAAGSCTVSGQTIHIVGVNTCTVTASQAGDANYNVAPNVSRTFLVAWPFTGFFAPVDKKPTINVANAGSAIPVKFALGGDRGLSILAAGSPVSTSFACTTGAPTDAVEETATAGQSGLNFGDGQYVYVWKTDKAWGGTCRELSVKLTDGTLHTARFQFRK
jgi:serine protease AprX